MKKQHAIWLVIFVLFLTNVSSSQPLFKWQRVAAVPTVPQQLTMHNGLLIAHTTNEAFISKDLGETWHQGGKHLDATFLTAKDSICIYRTPAKYVLSINPASYGSRIDWPTYVNGVPVTISGYIASSSGSKSSRYEELSCSSARIFNDNTILYTKTGTTVINPPYLPTETTYWSENGVIRNDGTRDLEHYPSGSVLGHLDDSYLYIESSNLVFKHDTNLVAYLSKPIPNIEHNRSAIIDSSIYLLNTDNGATLFSDDLGDSWESGSVALDDIYSYETAGHLHIVRTYFGDYLSQDFKTFTAFPNLDPADLVQKKYFGFGDVVFAIGNSKDHFYRSLDNGVSWEIIEYNGISSLQTGKLFTFNDTVYTRINNELYKKGCEGRFEISDNNQFLLGTNLFHGDAAFQVSNGILYKFNITTQTWDVNDLGFGNEQLKGVYQENGRIYLYGDLLKVSLDDGSTWTSITMPTSNLIQQFYALDSLIYVSDGANNYYSKDFGQIWLPMPSGRYYMLKNQFCKIENNILEVYDNPNQTPIKSLPVPPFYYYPFNNYAYFQAGDNIFCINFTNMFYFGQEYNDFKMYLYHVGDNEWRDVSADFPKWNEHSYNHFYFNTYAWKRGFNDVIYNNGDKSLYFRTTHSGFQRTSIGLVDTAGMAYQNVGSYCVGDSIYPTTKPGQYGQLVYHTCQPDSAYIFTTTYAQDTTITFCVEPGSSMKYGGHYFAHAGTYNINLVNKNGCDTLGHITIIEAKDSVFSLVRDTICFGDSLLVNGRYFESPGFYYDTISNLNACSKLIGTIELNSNITNTYLSGFKSFFVCEGNQLLYNGKYYESPGVYEDTLSQNTPCSWTIQKIRLFATPTKDVTTIHPNCVNDSILYQGNYYAFPGRYYLDTLYSEQGCDSLYHILDIKGIDNLPHDYQTNELHCPGDTVSWGNLVITSSGFYTDTLQNHCGLDSIITHKTFTYRPLEQTYEYSFLCEGDTIFNHQLVVTAPKIIPLDTIQSVITGCDSLIHYWQVNGLMSDTSFVETTVGHYVSDVYIMGDTMFTQVVVSQEYGCDSLHNTFIVTTPVSSVDLLSQKIKVYPNPTKDKLLISNFPKQTTRFFVRDVLNREIYHQDNSGDSVVELDVSSLQSGIYILELVDKNKQHYYVRFSKILE